MKVSLNGVLLRMRGNKGLRFMVEEFLKHFSMAKAALQKGDIETVKEFFALYINEGVDSGS